MTSFRRTAASSCPIVRAFLLTSVTLGMVHQKLDHLAVANLARRVCIVHGFNL